MRILKILLLFVFVISLGACGNAGSQPPTTPSTSTINSITTEEETLKKNYQPGDLAKAAYNGELDKVKSYLKIGINVNERDKHGGTALHAAMFQKNTEIITLLIENKADINIQGLSNHFTPLHDAVWANNLEAAKILLKAGADPTIKNNKNQTPLEKAKIEGRLEIAKLIESYNKK